MTKKTTKATDTKASNTNAIDRDTSRDRAAAEAKRDGNGEGNTDQVKAGEGEITQQKMTLGEGLAAGAASMDDIGKGSITETAPAVEGSLAAEAADRVVQQGDAVVLHTRNTWNGKTENVGRVLKVNQDSTIAVRIPTDLGPAKDFSPVYNRPMNGEDWWSWATDEQTATLDREFPAD